MNNIVIKNKLENVIFEGHGIGLSSKEYPIINNSVNYAFNNGFKEISADFVIEENMVINLEICCNYFTKKTFMIEKTYFVKKNSNNQIKMQYRDNPILL